MEKIMKAQFSAKFQTESKISSLVKVEYDFTNATEEHKLELMKRSLNIAFKARLKKESPTDEHFIERIASTPIFKVDVADLMTPSDRIADPLTVGMKQIPKMTAEQLKELEAEIRRQLELSEAAQDD